MISVTAYAGEAKAATAATAANCKNLIADFTIKPFQLALETLLCPSRALIKTLSARFQSAKGVAAHN